jgi:hypothetical protein
MPIKNRKKNVETCYKKRNLGEGGKGGEENKVVSLGGNKSLQSFFSSFSEFQKPCVGPVRENGAHQGASLANRLDS